MPKKPGDLVTHCNSVRARIVGDGALVALLYDSVGNFDVLANGTLDETSGRSVTQLANFKGERIAYEIRLTDIDEWFNVSNMFAYVKPTAASYPQP